VCTLRGDLLYTHSSHFKKYRIAKHYSQFDASPHLRRNGMLSPMPQINNREGKSAKQKAALHCSKYLQTPASNMLNQPIEARRGRSRQNDKGAFKGRIA